MSKFIIIDDPHYNISEEDSAKLRAKFLARLNTTLANRLNSRSTPIMMIFSRISNQDKKG